MKPKAKQSQTMVQFHASFQISLKLVDLASSSLRSQKKRQEFWLMCTTAKEEEGNFINHIFLISLLLSLIAALLKPWLTTARGLFLYGLLFSREFLYCLTNMLVLLPFTKGLKTSGWTAIECCLLHTFLWKKILAPCFTSSLYVLLTSIFIKASGQGNRKPVYTPWHWRTHGETCTGYGRGWTFTP